MVETENMPPGLECEYGKYCCCGKCMPTAWASCSEYKGKKTWMIAMAGMTCPDDPKKCDEKFDVSKEVKYRR